MYKKEINIHFLIPVWGEKYISQFMEIALPTLLSSGNIPYLAKQCKLTIVFLTTKKSIDTIQKSDNFSLLSNICNIEYEPIDDLIADCSNYAIPLTLAYVRGMTRIGQKMTQTYFIFYNADFILSNNSLSTILDLIRQGNGIIFATSFRIDAEKADTLLRELINSHSGDITARELVRFSLVNKHHTVISRTLNQDAYSSIYWNQVYWQVDDNTILARYFLTTLFCFRPLHFNQTINSFIDYSMVDDFCKNGKVSAIADSDDFFLLEMQSFQQELHFLKIGTPDRRKVADSLSSWTTLRHRRQAQYETIIHGDDLPPVLEKERRRFHAVMAEVERYLTPHPLRPESHQHWVGALTYWMPRKMRYDAMQNCSQPFSGLSLPLVRLGAGLEKKIRGNRAQAMALFLGVPPKTFPWHPLWGNYHAIQKSLQDNLSPNQELLFVTDCFSYDGLVIKHGKVTKVFAADVLNGHLGKICLGKNFSVCLIAVESEKLDVQRFIKNITPHMNGNKTVIIFFGKTMLNIKNRNKNSMIVYFHAMKDLYKYNPNIFHIGNEFGDKLTILMWKAIYRMSPIKLLPYFLCISCACLINNLYCLLFSRVRFPHRGTGVLAIFSLKGEEA